jgi:hypothetical protein
MGVIFMTHVLKHRPTSYQKKRKNSQVVKRKYAFEILFAQIDTAIFAGHKQNFKCCIDLHKHGIV